MPSHNHKPANANLCFTLNQSVSSASVARRNVTTGSGNIYAMTADKSQSDNINDVDSITECSTTADTGGNAAHSLMQPFLSVFMWRRTN